MIHPTSLSPDSSTPQNKHQGDLFLSAHPDRKRRWNAGPLSLSAFSTLSAVAPGPNQSAYYSRYVCPTPTNLFTIVHHLSHPVIRSSHHRRSPQTSLSTRHQPLYRLSSLRELGPKSASTTFPRPFLSLTANSASSAK